MLVVAAPVIIFVKEVLAANQQSLILPTTAATDHDEDLLDLYYIVILNRSYRISSGRPVFQLTISSA